MEENSRAQRINLFCPSLLKLASIVAWDDQRLDLGAIARTFGVEPATLKLNGHFISRGVDLVASSVTWKSLLSFFSARGLSTGTVGSPALIVDGKLCKSGTKRAHDPAEVEKVECAEQSLREKVRVHVNPQSMSKKMKMKENSSWRENQEDPTLLTRDGLGLKRKLWLETSNPLKRSKADGTYTNSFSKRYEASGKEMPGATKFTCSYQSKAIKRAREEEALVAAACKRTR